MNDSQILLDIRNLKKEYILATDLLGRPTKTLKAVDNVNMQIHRGEVVGLVGESGCGKSTLGRTVLKLHSVTGGEILFDDRHIEGLNSKQMRPFRKDMQMIFQDPYASLSPRMTIIDSVKVPLDVQTKLSTEEKLEKTRETLKEVGVSEHHFYKYPHELSGGQRQRVVIARAMITDPSFIVCDEPVSALDVSVRAQVLNLMRRMQRKTGVSYLFISHDLSVIKYICDTIYVMYLGRIVEKADKKEIFANPLHPYTKALMSAIPIPDIHAVRDQMILQGDIPSPVHPPKGCHFHTRCPFATERCCSEAPTLKEVCPGHSVACHLVESQGK